MDNIILNNGLTIPKIGTGPSSAAGWDDFSFFPSVSLGRKLNRLGKRIRNKYRRTIWRNNLAEQFRIGYRLVDHSISYGDEFLIKQAIEQAGLVRKDVFVASRFANLNQYQGNLCEAFKRAKNALGGGPIDLFGFHWPVPEHYINTYKFLEKLYKDGEIRAISICNCHEHHLERILEECEIVPAINQVEIHPLFTQNALVDYCQRLSITVQAYTPLARNDDRLSKVVAIASAAEKYNKSSAQVILRWHTQRGVVPIPRSTNLQRLSQNIDIFDFELSAEEMSAISAANIDSRLRYSPDNCNFAQL